MGGQLWEAQASRTESDRGSPQRFQQKWVGLYVQGARKTSVSEQGESGTPVLAAVPSNAAKYGGRAEVYFILHFLTSNLISSRKGDAVQSTRLF